MKKIYEINNHQIWYTNNLSGWVCYPVDKEGNFLSKTKFTFEYTNHKTKEEAINFAKSKEICG